MSEEPGVYEKIDLTNQDIPVIFHKDRLSTSGGNDHFYCHWHDHIEMLYITQGELSVRCNTRYYLGHVGDLIVVNSNELHQGRCLHGSVEYDCIIFDAQLLQGRENDAYEAKYIGPIFKNNILFSNVIKNDPKISSYIYRFADEYESKRIGFEIALKAIVFELILYLLRNYVKQSLTSAEYESRIRQLKRFNKILKYIDENCGEKITLDIVCKMAGVTRYYFCRLFKAATGYTFNDYLNRQRIQQAEAMLMRGDRNVTETALACGFDDMNYFSRLFRRYKNISPSRVGNAPLLDLIDNENSRTIEKETVDMIQKTNTHMAPPRYDETLKQGAARMTTEQKRPIKKAAPDLGICTDTLKKWLKDAGIQPIAADHGNRDANRIHDLETENRALRKSLSEKEEALEILKKSVGIPSRP